MLQLEAVSFLNLWLWTNSHFVCYICCNLEQILSIKKIHLSLDFIPKWHLSQRIHRQKSHKIICTGAPGWLCQLSICFGSSHGSQSWDRVPDWAPCLVVSPLLRLPLLLPLLVLSCSWSLSQISKILKYIYLSIFTTNQEPESYNYWFVRWNVHSTIRHLWQNMS